MEEPSTKSKNKKSKKRAADDDDGDDLDFAFGGGSIKKKRNRNMFSDSGSDFAAAEEFAALLEAAANANPDLNIEGTSEALSNKDRASTKQLQWEMARDRWMKDLNRPHRGGNFKSQNKRRPQRGGPKCGGKR